MAVSTSSYFSNTSRGFMEAGFDFNPYESNSSPKLAVGTGVADQRGNVYRYSHFGAAVNAGVIVAQDYSESSQDESLNSVVAPASAQAVPNESISAGKIGSRFVEMTLSGISADQFAGGDLCITSDTGAGFTYRIRGNTATDDPATGNILQWNHNASQISKPLFPKSARRQSPLL